MTTLAVVPKWRGKTGIKLDASDVASRKDVASDKSVDILYLAQPPASSALPSSASPDLNEEKDLNQERDFDEEKKELEWLLCCPEISRSASLVRFLSFVCNKYFEGEAKDIREYTVAVEALGRKESSFDSHVDPIVRVTARALRKRLDEIYKSDGQNHSLHITLPLGHYVPQFVRQQNRSAVPALPATEIRSAERQNAAAPVRISANPDVTWKRATWKTVPILLAVYGVFFAGFFLGHHSNHSTIHR